MFTTRIGTPVDPANLLDDFRARPRQGKKLHIRFHDLRHSAASLLLALNIHPRVVMELLGHSQISLTMDTYGRAELLRDAVDKLGTRAEQGLSGSLTGTEEGSDRNDKRASVVYVVWKPLVVYVVYVVVETS